MFSRATSRPAATKAPIWSGPDVAGPRVATIFARRLIRLMLARSPLSLGVADPVARRQLQRGAGQVVRADPAAAAALPHGDIDLFGLSLLAFRQEHRTGHRSLLATSVRNNCSTSPRR